MTYGWMTKSWLNSTEHRQMKEERRKATESWKPGKQVEILIACTCRYKPFAHLTHAELTREYNWRERK